MVVSDDCIPMAPSLISKLRNAGSLNVMNLGKPGTCCISNRLAEMPPMVEEVVLVEPKSVVLRKEMACSMSPTEKERPINSFCTQHITQRKARMNQELLRLMLVIMMM